MKGMRQFAIPLKNEKVKLYNRITWLIIVVNFLLLTYLSLFASANDYSYMLWGCQLIIIAILFIGRLRARPTSRTEFLLILLILCFCWLLVEYYWVGALCLVFGILQWFATRKLIIRVNEDKVIYPSLPEKKLSWTTLTNLLIKDGLFTMDMKSNRFIQQRVEESSSVNEQDFNEFCRQQLK